MHSTLRIRPPVVTTVAMTARWVRMTTTTTMATTMMEERRKAIHAVTIAVRTRSRHPRFPRYLQETLAWVRRLSAPVPSIRTRRGGPSSFLLSVFQHCLFGLHMWSEWKKLDLISGFLLLDTDDYRIHLNRSTVTTFCTFHHPSVQHSIRIFRHFSILEHVSWSFLYRWIRSAIVRTATQP